MGKNINENLPIITIHKGAPFYLKNALDQASFFNPDSTVYLLGDESNKFLERSNIKHYYIKDYFVSANEFASKYVHMSLNHYNYEILCFQRWFVIRDFVFAHNLSKFFVFDSDVLLYCNVSVELNNFQDYDYTICNERILSTTFMNIKLIEDFAKFIYTQYSDSEAFKRLQAIYKSCFNNKGKLIRLEGINDLTMIDLFKKNVLQNVLDIGIPNNGMIFDAKMNCCNDFTMDKYGLKKVFWINDLPYGKYGENEEMVRFCSLHFQGRSKMRQHYYLINSEGKHIDPIPFSIRWVMFYAWCHKIFNGIRKFKFYCNWFLQNYLIKERNKKRNKLS